MRPEPPHSSQPLCSPDFSLVHSKVVRDFVPERLLDQTFQIVAAAREPFVGTLEYGDLVRQVERLKNTALGQRPPLIQSEKRAARRDSSRL